MCFVKQYLRGYDLARCGLGGPVGLSLAQRCLRASKRVWSQHGQIQKPDLATRKIVSHRRKFVVAPIPKVGTKTLKVMLQTLGADQASDVDIEFVHAPLYRCLSGLGEGYTVFSLVRNPWSRVASCYRNKIISSHLGDLAIRSRYADLTPDLSFDDFVLWLDSEEGRDEIADRHWISQTRLLTEPGTDELLCTQIGKFETFIEDIQRFLEQIGLGHLTIPHINRTNSSADPESYRSVYNAKTRDIVARRYRSDIETFGYSF